MNRCSVAIVIILIGIFCNITKCEELGGLLESNPITVNTGTRAGRVVDAITGEPVQDAVVLYIWDVEEFLIESHSRPAALYETVTGSDGEYLIPNQQVEINHPVMSKLEPEEVFVYKYGYVSYRVYKNKARSFLDYLPGLQQEYRKENNVIKLQPWIDELSHSEHVAFLDAVAPRPGGQLLPKALEQERGLAKREHEAAKPLRQKVEKAKKEFYRDRDAYKKGNITKEQYVTRLHKYLQIPDSALLKFVSIALKDFDDPAAIPVLFEFLKKNMYRKSFEEAFYSLRWAIGNKTLEAPGSVPERKDIVARMEAWWEQNKYLKSTEWNAEEIDNLHSAASPEEVRIPVKDGDLLVAPALLEFSASNDSPLVVFKNFRAALLEGDIDKLIACFVPYKRAERTEFYSQLKPHWVDMAKDMKGLVLVSQSDTMVECEILREEHGEMFGFPIVFVKAEDGNWKIQEL